MNCLSDDVIVHGIIVFKRLSGHEMRYLSITRFAAAALMFVGISVANAAQPSPIDIKNPLASPSYPVAPAIGVVAGVWYWENQCFIRVDVNKNQSGAWLPAKNNKLCKIAFYTNLTGQRAGLHRERTSDGKLQYVSIQVSEDL